MYTHVYSHVHCILTIVHEKVKYFINFIAIFEKKKKVPTFMLGTVIRIKRTYFTVHIVGLLTRFITSLLHKKWRETTNLESITFCSVPFVKKVFPN